ncbi:phage tail protein [Marinobacter nauticus]|uniref:phage tail-collar fiber domain-containing protein n=1 Tax=Marinobacter nauticus TaxID=2743 RepID=UPI001C998269|nr:phage tail protein [Marinobacter nauticus]MBY5938044.1 phage tail protein [Marinobacter nauticus]MBY5955273.1 phage tail protein [Marinobacter nauticus]MBY6009064.1 phage tail protein [Marinobacter nauticus]
MADYYVIATTIGEAKMANALALGIPLAITDLALGDGEGNGARGTPVPNPEATALVSERRRAPLNSFSVDPDNANVLIAEQVIPETAGGWWIREMGLFDEDGDLIFVCNTPPTYKPQLSEGSGRTQVVRVNCIVSDTAAVTLKVDPSVVLATRHYAQQLLVEHEAEFQEKIDERVIYIDSIDELKTLDTAPLKDGQHVSVANSGLHIYNKSRERFEKDTAVNRPDYLMVGRPVRSGQLAARGGAKFDYNSGKALVSFVDDDAWSRAYTYLYPLLVDKQVPFGFAVPSNKLDTAGYLTLAQLREIIESTGSEVMSHGYNELGFNSATDEQIEFECRESKKQLESYGFTVDQFVPVGGQDSGKAQSIIDKYFMASYVTQENINLPPFVGELRVSRHNFGAGGPVKSLQYYKDIIDQAIALGGWVVFMTHVGSPAYQDADHDLWLPELIDYIKFQGVEIVTPREGLTQFGQVIRQERPEEGTYFRLAKNGQLQSSDLDAKYYDFDDSRPFAAGLDEYPRERAVVAVYSEPGLGAPTGNTGTLITHRPDIVKANTNWGWQVWRGSSSKVEYIREWLQSDPEGPGVWGEWQISTPNAGYDVSTLDTPAEIRAKVGNGILTVSSTYGSSAAEANNLPSYGHMVTHLGKSGQDWASSQTYYSQTGEITFRHWDRVAGAWSDWKELLAIGEKITYHTQVLNFGTVAAQDTKSIDVAISGVYPGHAIVVTSRQAMPAGTVLSASCYAVGMVTVELMNAKPTSISVSGRDIDLKVDRRRG